MKWCKFPVIYANSLLDPPWDPELPREGEDLGLQIAFSTDFVGSFVPLYDLHNYFSDSATKQHRQLLQLNATISGGNSLVNLPSSD